MLSYVNDNTIRIFNANFHILEKKSGHLDSEIRVYDTETNI